MVRVYTRKTTPGDYGQGNLANALAAIQNGQALKAAARDFGVPPKTLRRHRDGNVRMPGSISLGPICQVLPTQLEEELARYIREMEVKMFALSTKDVRRLAFELAERR